MCSRAGVTYRQLDRWCALGVIRPVGAPAPGTGFPRRFLPAEVRVVSACGRLAELGVNTEVLREVAEELRVSTDDSWRGTVVVSRNGLVLPADDDVSSFGEACWLLNLGVIAARAESA